MNISFVLRHNANIEDRAHAYLSSIKLVQDRSCIRCGLLSSIIAGPDETRFTYKYQCHYCGIRYNSFTGTRFDGSRVRMCHIVFLIHFFASNYSVHLTHALLCDFTPFYLSKVTVRRMHKLLRRMLCEKIREEVNTMVLEGPVRDRRVPPL
jgi:hypothetical protein